MVRKQARLLSDRLEDRLAPVLDLTGVEWRTITGENNNEAKPTQGAAETLQIRFGYGDDFPDDNGDQIVLSPNPRTVSNAVLAQSGSIPSGRLLTDWAFQWGQWVTHDMDLTRNHPDFDVLSDGTTGDFRIPVLDANDPLGPNPIPFNRSEFAPGTGANGVRRDVVNSITSYIDASHVYGSDDARTDNLRTFVGGKLKTSANGRLLPLNTVGEENADPFGLGAQLFLAGDMRANEQLGLTAVHTLFVREHNRLADRINALHPGMSDEDIFQVARRLVGAEQQIITYEEYLPAILGWDLAPDADDAVYNPNVDASVTNSFAHAAFRFGHSQINETTLLVNSSGQTVSSLSIREAFFNPDFLKDDPGNVGLMLKGLASQIGQENDMHLTDGVRNNLFGPPGAGGLDLGSLDIQRGRDHGLPDFNNLFGAYRAGGLEDADGNPATPLTAVTLDSFAQLRGDPNSMDSVEAALDALYDSINTLDPFVGMLAEDHLPGASVGRLLNSIIGSQFARLRDGDRFFYTLDPFLQDPAVKAILDVEDVTLAKVIRRNTNASGLQDNVFFDKSVLIFEARDKGMNLSLTANSGMVRLTNTRNGNVIDQRSPGSVQQVILVGSDSAPDVINLFIAGANGGIENGVIMYGGGSPDDRLNVFGRSTHDTFAVTDSSFSTGTVGTLRRPPENAVTQAFVGRAVDVNGNDIVSFGFETTRIVTNGGNDTVIDPTGLATVVSAWDPTRDD